MFSGRLVTAALLLSLSLPSVGMTHPRRGPTSHSKPRTQSQPKSSKRTSLKAALSDQKVVAGLGNIYVCEALHRAHLSPRRAAGTLATRSGVPTPRAEALVNAVRDVLHDAIKAGGSSLRDHRRTDGELGDFQHNFRVYDRAGEKCPTPKCKGTIRRIVQGARSTFFCPVCQR